MGGMSFENRTILVTGGLGGIGGEVTRLFIERGAHVVVSDRPQDRCRTRVAAHSATQASPIVSAGCDLRAGLGCRWSDGIVDRATAS